MLVLVIALIVGLFATAAYGNALLSKQSKKLEAVKVENKVTEEQEKSLAQAKKDIEKYKDLNAIAKSIVPQDKDQAKTTREISRLTEESGVKLQEIKFQTSTLGQTPAAAQPASGGDTTKTPAAPPLSQVKSVDGIPGVYSLEMVITTGSNSVTYQQLITFLEKLESNRRTAHVDKVSITPNNSGTGFNFTLTLKAYVKP